VGQSAAWLAVVEEYLATAARVVIDGPGHVFELASARCGPADDTALSMDKMPDPGDKGMRVIAPASCVQLKHFGA
jgi:hypothetical protein